MKIAKKEQKMLLYVLGLLMLIAVYFLYYSAKQTELDELQDEVNSLHSEVQKLEDYEFNSKDYQNDTKRYYKEIEEIASKFPALVKEEDGNMYMRGLEQGYGVEVSNITMQPLALLSSFGVGERQKNLYSMQVGVTMSGSYDAMKQVIENIQQNPDKRNITALSLNYDPNTGLLSGNASLNLYAMSGKDKEYATPQTRVGVNSTLNIFGQ